MFKTISMFSIAIFFITGCVTVNLGGGSEGKRAEGVALREPSNPFSKEKRGDVDGAWKNPSNGNVISYLSDCRDPSDPTLETIVQGVVAGLSELKYESNERRLFQSREALRVVASGKVDGVPSKTELLVFKRNQCIYILSYVGVQRAFEANRSDFEKFVEGFRAP